jgi:hypothetical protein
MLHALRKILTKQGGKFAENSTANGLSKKSIALSCFNLRRFRAASVALAVLAEPESRRAYSFACSHFRALGECSVRFPAGAFKAGRHGFQASVCRRIFFPLLLFRACSYICKHNKFLL